MRGPARAGVLLYASDPERLARFYTQLLGMALLNRSAERLILESPDLQLIIHALPPEVAPTVRVQSPPIPRQMPLRFFHTIPNLSAAHERVAALGGQLYPERWPGPGFTVCNAMDPEGNIFQLREFTA